MISYIHFGNLQFLFSLGFNSWSSLCWSLSKCMLSQGETKGSNNRVESSAHSQNLRQLLQLKSHVPLSFFRFWRENKNSSSFVQTDEHGIAIEFDSVWLQEG